MPQEQDSFGGIAVDEDPVVDEFGGQLIQEDTPETPQRANVNDPLGLGFPGMGQGAPQDIGLASAIGTEPLTKPLVTLPSLQGSDPRFRAFIAGATGRLPSVPAAETLAAAANVGKSLPEFLSSPLGVATAPIAAGGGVPARLLGLGFAGQMAASVPEAARQAGTASVEGTPQQAKESLLNLGANVLLPATLAAPAIAEGGRMLRRAPRAIPAPIAPETPPTAPEPAAKPPEAPPVTPEALSEPLATPEAQAAEQARLAAELGQEEPSSATPTPAEAPTPVPAPAPVTADAILKMTPDEFYTWKRDPANQWSAPKVAEIGATLKPEQIDEFAKERDALQTKAAENQKALGEMPKTPEEFDAWQKKEFANQIINLKAQSLNELIDAAPKPAVETPAIASEVTTEKQYHGKTLDEWLAIKSKEDLPKGDARDDFRRLIGAPANQPQKIFQYLKANEAKIRKRIAEINKPPISPAEAVASEPAKPAEPPVPATAETPPQATAKVQDEVSKVAAVEGQRPAKAVKSELVSRLEKAIEDAPNDSPEIVKARADLEKAIKKKRGVDFATKDLANALEKSGIGKVTIDIPGDGTFTIWNTKPTLTELLDRAKRIPTTSGTPVRVSRTGVTKEQAKEFIKEAEQPPPGPGKIGMGGAALEEIQPTGPRGEPTHGIAARVLEQRRQQGVIAPVEPGEGITPQESIERGRQLIAEGANPQAVLDAFNRTKAVSAEGIAIARAHGERLARTAYAMADAHGIHSPEYEAAWEADSAWAKAVKPMQTEWHKIGQAQQGETEIDTGTFHGLRKAFLDATGKDFTPEQAAEAEKIAKGVKEATEAADKAKDEVFAEVAKQAKTTPETKPAAPKPGEVASPDPITLWKRAKAILDAGEDDFDAIRHQLAIEFGIPVEEVTRKLAENKTAREITDEMWSKQAARRKAVDNAKAWLLNQSMPGWQRIAKVVPAAFFKAATFGHGTVGMITHAGLNIFNPAAGGAYWTNFGRQYKLFWSGLRGTGYHERMMQDLLHDPLYTKARRAGLANDPFLYHDDYQTPALIQWLDRKGLSGNKGFDALKLFRQARFNQIWNTLPGTLKTPEYAKLLADSVNHATGVVRRPFREWANWTFFAPKLEASRWAWMVKDPWEAAKTFVDWNKATPEARAFAMSQLKEKATIAGVYSSLLLVNNGLLSATGSDQRINFTNPRRGDFLAFKAAGHNIGIVGPMLGIVRLFANLYHAAAGKRSKVESLSPRYAEMGSIGAEYARGKLSPFAGFGVDLASQADFQGRPMPFSSDKTPKYLRQQGLGPYTYGEYALTKAPIPASEAAREVWRAQGMGEDFQDYWLKALTVTAAAALTGVRVSQETPPTKTKK